jgi:fructose-1,6-bisphosphatase class II
MASSITVPHNLMLDRILTMEIVRVTERAAVNAARLRGRGEEKAADQAAVDAMRRELNNLPIDGTVVIGEGEMDEAPMLFIGEKVGAKGGFKVDIAVDPLEGTTLCAKNMPGAIATIAIAEGGTLLHAPDIYMDKIAVGPGYPKDVINLDAPADENIRALAKAKGVKPEGITAMLLDRPRHADMIAAVRKTGAAVSLITDGDVAAVIHTAEPEKTGVDIFLGIGGAGRRAGGRRAALHRRPDAMPARRRYRREARARRQDGHQGPTQEISDRGHGARRLPVCRDRHYRRPHAAGCQVRQRHCRDADRGDALGHRHRALDPRRASAAGEVLGSRFSVAAFAFGAMRSSLQRITPEPQHLLS